MKALIVTAADEAYAPLVRDLLNSLEPQRARLDLAIACLDLGLAPQTSAELTRRIEHVVAPAWPFRPHERFTAERHYLARAARPFLPDLVPGYAMYLWLDADVWVQHALGLEWLIDAARRADIAAVPTIHRAYTFTPRDITWVLERYRMAFGENMAHELARAAYVNSGVIAARAGSPLWRRFAQRFQTALDNWQGDFLSDQAVLNAVLQLDGLKVERLPARANWLCHLSKPVWSKRARCLVEPAMPFEPLLLIHNSLNDKQEIQTLPALDGQPRKTRLTFAAVNALHYSESQ